jgi:alkylhydroperoxidase family enzyme
MVCILGGMMATMPLVAPLSPDASPEVAELALLFNQTLGFVPNSVLTMLRRPEIARAFTALNRAVMTNQGRVGSELKRLIAHVASNAAGCRYCQAHTIRAAARYGAQEGADPARLEAVWDYRHSALFNEGVISVLTESST